MALDPQQQQFATSVPAAPLLDKAMEGLGKGIDYFMNEVVIGKLGAALDAATSEIRGLGKGAITDLRGSKLAGDPSSAPPLTPSKTPESSERGESQQIAKAVVPEKVISQIQSLPVANSKMAVAHVPDGTEVCPMCTPNMNYGISQGRGVVG